MALIVASRAEAWIETSTRKHNAAQSEVASRAEAWIETASLYADLCDFDGRLPCGGVD